MQCITVNQKGRSDPSTTKNQELESANTVLPANGLNNLLSRTLRNRPANEDRIRGMPEDVEACPAKSEPNEQPFFFSSSEYERLYNAPGVTDAHRVWIDKFFEAGIFVMDGDNPKPTSTIEEA